MNKISMVTAGAGTGKTTYIINELLARITEEKVQAQNIIVTTFTRKAARELQERIQQSLADKGMFDLSARAGEMNISTVHGVCQRLLTEHCFEVGLSPELSVLSETDHTLVLNSSIEESLSTPMIRKLNILARKNSIDDWRQEVVQIILEARANGLSPQLFEEFARQSIEEQMKCYPPTRKEKYFEHLPELIESTLGDQSYLAKTDKARGALTHLSRFAHELRGGEARWSSWVRASVQSPGKRGGVSLDNILELISEYPSHPLFKNDVCEFIQAIFEAAHLTLNHYQEMKRKMGVLDFTDMESRLLDFLRSDQSSQILKGKIELLMVDEFQDTNPMQLAIFLELARLAGQSIFVGDQKQAIYGFRGTDPSIIGRVSKTLEESGCERKSLDINYRSQAPLVTYANRMFSELMEGQFEVSEVELKPHREEERNFPALLSWQLAEKTNKEGRFKTFAQAVRKLLEQEMMIQDKTTGAARRVSAGDVGVLLRTNDNVKDLVKSLTQENIPADMALKGFIHTPEIVLVLACLRFLVDGSDSLAEAEIVSLELSLEPEKLLNSRLLFLKGEEDVHWPPREAEIPGKLDELRKAMRYLGVVDIVGAVIGLGIEEIVLGWGRDFNTARRRIGNLYQLRDYALEYEERSRQFGVIPGLPGFSAWLVQLHESDIDEQFKASDIDAVHVMTRHKAKGLEFPIVILCDLDSVNQMPWHGVHVKSSSVEVDLEDPLKGRYLEYWLRPFGQLSRGVFLDAEVKSTSHYHWLVQKEKEEALRLFYVMVTRARDQLIYFLPDPKSLEKKPGWMGWFELLPFLPARASNEKLRGIWHEVIDVVWSELEVKETDTFVPRWFAAEEDVENRELWISPSSLPALENVKPGEIMDIPGSPEFRSQKDADIFGEVLHAALAWFFGPASASISSEQLESMLLKSGFSSQVKVEDLLHYMNQFKSHLSSNFNPEEILTEFPVQLRMANGQILRGNIDLLLRSKDGWIIIDHKVSVGDKDFEPYCKRYSGQLSAYKDAVIGATEQKVKSCWLHLVGQGKLVEIVFG
jgi:ATP-dependent helicase/nuclease subunit A